VSILKHHLKEKIYEDADVYLPNGLAVVRPGQDKRLQTGLVPKPVSIRRLKVAFPALEQ